MSVTIHSPYNSTKRPWLRGNLHTHSTNSDGEKTPEELAQIYGAKGYDWLCISDHDFITEKPASFPEEMVFVPGNEITARGSHLLHIGAEDLVYPDPNRESVIRRISETRGLCILNHPNWERDYNHWPQGVLESMPKYDGIEIYNAVIRRHPGSPLATDRWDQLLSKGIRVWGYANDDAHLGADCGIAWNVASCPRRDAPTIMDSLRRGRFYASTGVELSCLETWDDQIRIVSKNGTACVAIMDDGVEIGRWPGRSWEFDLVRLIEGIEPAYIRFEVLGDAGAAAWTQPIHLRHN